jgi:hypothetical protein
VKVRQTGTYAEGLQRECMEVWGVTVCMKQVLIFCARESYFCLAEMLTFETTYNATNIPRHLRVKCFLNLMIKNV